MNAVAPDLVERLRHAIEGECDGLDPGEQAARNILAYLGAAAPEAPALTALRKLLDCVHEGRLVPDNPGSGDYGHRDT